MPVLSEARACSTQAVPLFPARVLASLPGSSPPPSNAAVTRFPKQSSRCQSSAALSAGGQRWSRSAWDDSGLQLRFPMSLFTPVN